MADTSDIGPVPQTWYRDMNSRSTFLVTGVDRARSCLEVQHRNGDIEEIDLAEWSNLDLELAEPPEDWSGPFDRVEAEDLDDGEASARKEPPGTQQLPE